MSDREFEEEDDDEDWTDTTWADPNTAAGGRGAVQGRQLGATVSLYSTKKEQTTTLSATCTETKLTGNGMFCYL